MNKIKILYILTKSGIGGAQKYVADLSENLDKNKFETRIFYGGIDINPVRSRPAEGGATAISGQPASNGVKWLSNKTYPWFLFINDWLAIFEIARILRKERPNIIHLNSSKAGFIGAISAIIANFNSTKKIRVVFTAHGWVFNTTNELSWLVRQFYIFLHKIACLFTNEIICVSEHDHNLALEYDICAPEKLSTIHNGIDPNMKFMSKKEARSDLMIKLFNDLIIKNQELQNKNWKWVGSIGRLVKEKNYETLIEAAKLVPNTYFFIIGEGPKLDNLKFKIQDLRLADRFFIINPSGDDARYLKAFDVFAMSSIKEGLPYILLEAMAAELPIVITEAGGMPELIKNHENGLMVAQKNPEALARAIGGLIQNKIIAKELSQKAKEIVIEKFSLKKMLKETEVVYLKI